MDLESCWSTVENLEIYSQRCSLIIEEDIVSAYNNVDHDIMLEILKQKIKDKHFLSLIRDMLKSGIMDDK